MKRLQYNFIVVISVAFIQGSSSCELASSDPGVELGRCQLSYIPPHQNKFTVGFNIGTVGFNIDTVGFAG